MEKRETSFAKEAAACKLNGEGFYLVISLDRGDPNINILMMGDAQHGGTPDFGKLPFGFQASFGRAASDIGIRG